MLLRGLSICVYMLICFLLTLQQRQKLSEVENLYFRHSHTNKLRAISPPHNTPSPPLVPLSESSTYALSTAHTPQAPVQQPESGPSLSSHHNTGSSTDVQTPEQAFPTSRKCSLGVSLSVVAHEITDRNSTHRTRIGAPTR